MKDSQKESIFGGRKKKSPGERIAGIFFRGCAAFALSAVLAMTVYLFISGFPAIREVGVREILTGTSWKPTAEEPAYGIAYVILTSVVGTFFAVLIGVPLGILTAVFLAEFSGKKLAGVIRAAVELLAGIPSVIYGLLGLYLLSPLMYRLERKLFSDSGTHQFTGGANLLSAVLVLAVLVLPTVVNVSETAIRSVRRDIKEASLALGASHMQTIFRAVLPSARSGIATAAGNGRSDGNYYGVGKQR